MGAHKFNPRAAGNTGYSGGMAVKDAYGRDLTENDEVIAHVMKLNAPRFLIKQIRPNLAPGAEPNTLLVVMIAQVMMSVRSNTPVQELIRTRTAEELGLAAPAAEAEDAADAPPPAGPVGID